MIFPPNAIQAGARISRKHRNDGMLSRRRDLHPRSRTPRISARQRATGRRTIGRDHHEQANGRHFPHAGGADRRPLGVPGDRDCAVAGARRDAGELRELAGAALDLPVDRRRRLRDQGLRSRHHRQQMRDHVHGGRARRQPAGVANVAEFEAVAEQGGMLCRNGQWRAFEGGAKGTTPFRFFFKDGVFRARRERRRNLSRHPEARGSELEGCTARASSFQAA